jgi:nicotinamide-nucleotide amidase
VQHSLEDHAEHVVKLARDRHMTLATVESCTAGSLAHLLTQADGASEAVHGAFVVYTKENKIAAVGVPVDLLAQHSAVSAEVALAMANGGLERCPASLVAAITGVARHAAASESRPLHIGNLRQASVLRASESDGRLAAVSQRTCGSMATIMTESRETSAPAQC